MALQQSLLKYLDVLHSGLLEELVSKELLVTMCMLNVHAPCNN